MGFVVARRNSMWLGNQQGYGKNWELEWEHEEGQGSGLHGPDTHLPGQG